MESLLLLAALAVAFVNGANDNTKGVATLYGSGLLSYGAALALATVSTASGSLLSVHLGAGLARAFSAKGLIPDALLSTEFLAAVAMAAASAVLLATRLGLPVSTTHALLGGIAGAGLVTAGRELNVMALGTLFVAPLLASPLAAVALAAGLYLGGRLLGRTFGIRSSTCVCLDRSWTAIASTGTAANRIALQTPAPGITVAETTRCRAHSGGRLLGVSARQLSDCTHLLSGAFVGFARGLNDTPKLLGLLAGVAFLSPGNATLALAAAMALGGLVASRRVADTLARKVTEIDPEQGLASNLVTSCLVCVASRFGMPVSTTHVSAGGIFGVGAVRGALRRRTVAAILLAWVTTLPLAAALGALMMRVLA